MNQFKTKEMQSLSIQKAVATRKRNQLEKKLVSFFRKFYVLAIMSLITGNIVISLKLQFDDFTAQISVVEAKTLIAKPQQATEAPVNIQDYVFNEVEKALGRSEAITALRIVACESNFRPDIVTIEPNNSVSLGIFQINSIHNRLTSPNYISNADKLDIKKATAWAIKKRISDQNWNAWTCGK